MAENGTQIAKAYVQIVPSARGIKSALQEQMGPDLDQVGKSSGEQVGSKFASAIKSAIAAVGVGKLLKESLLAGADLEQSLGGVETLFKDSSDRVIYNARRAYETAGMSANEYMQTVTGFSASLLSSLGGDTEAAASIADQAIIDMSDNANKMGTSIESIQNAYQGFAKQNYTMLDNLKLGYGGTKEEMQRLLDDAEKLSGVHYDISSLSDVYSAIHEIQTSLDITGTTAKEASVTFTGSFNAMKAAGSDLMADLSSGTGDLNDDIKKLASSADTFARGNLLPFLGNIVGELNDIDGALGVVIKTVEMGAVYMALTKVVGVIEATELGTMALGTAVDTLKTKGMEFMAANPYLLAFAALTTAAFVLKSHIDEITDSMDVAVSGYDQMTETQKAMYDSVTGTTSGIFESIDARQRERSEIEATVQGYGKLKDRLYELDEQEDLDTASKAEMAAIVQELNENVDGLNIALDEETGHLMTSKAAIDKRIDSLKREAQAEAARQQMVEIYKEQAQAEKALETAEKEYTAAKQRRSDLEQKYLDYEAELIEKYGSLNSATHEEKQALQDIQDEYDRANGSIGDLAAAYTSASQAVRDLDADADECAGKVAAASESASSSVGVLRDAVTEFDGQTYAVSQTTLDRITEMEDEYDQLMQKQNDSLRNSLGIFEEFDGGVQKSAEELMEALHSQTMGLEGWAENIEALSGRAIDDGLLQYLIDLGPEGANAVQTFADMSDDELEKYQSYWKQREGAIEDVNSITMRNVREETNRQIKGLLDDSQAYNMTAAMKGSNIGRYFADGIGDGFEAEMARVSVRTTNLADYYMVQAVRKKLQINSPSKVSEEIGEFYAKGFPEGVENEAGNVRQRIMTLTRQMVPGFDTKASAPAVQTGPAVGTITLRLADQAGRIIAEAVQVPLDRMDGQTVTLSERGLAI